MATNTHGELDLNPTTEDSSLPPSRMKSFYPIVANALVASFTNTVVWFAVTFWVYLNTQSVLATSIMAGVYLATIALSGFVLGSIVDRSRKKTAMLLSSVGSLTLYTLAFGIYATMPAQEFANSASGLLWLFIILALFGAIVGNLRGIALSTLVTLLIPPAERAKANGIVGTANGTAFLLASLCSGLVIGYLGMFWMLVLALTLNVLVIVHLWTLAIQEREITPSAEAQTQSLDIRGTIRAIRGIPGLFALIFFQTFNNFLGGVFMSLMDPYGLSLVSVQVWGSLWGILSLGFIVGGMAVAKRGLGRQPLRTLFLCNIVMWIICIVFTIQPSVILLTVGLFAYLCLIPVAEAAEQTILQQTIPPERQGRVFGLAQSIEQAAAPVTAFVVGPLAQFVFIPFMTTGTGAVRLGAWFGTGPDRGIALLFTVTGMVGLGVTLLAMRSHGYKSLFENYQKHRHPEPAAGRAVTSVLVSEGSVTSVLG